MDRSLANNFLPAVDKFLNNLGLEKRGYKMMGPFHCRHFIVEEERKLGCVNEGCIPFRESSAFSNTLQNYLHM